MKISPFLSRLHRKARHIIMVKVNIWEVVCICMETEMLTIFDESGSAIGVATRDEVHNKGYWHQTFQCYVVGKENHEEYMYLQLRSHLKKDFANVYDITAAGHILSNETVADGVREVNEELGLNVTYDQLNSLGMFPNVIETETIKDHELSHVFLYEMTEPMETFILQPEEVSGMAKARLYDFISFYNGDSDHLEIEGYKQDSSGGKTWFKETISKDRFVPHSKQYFVSVAEAICSNRKA